MSTFDGVVAEFPDIRIDCFRRDPARPPALAYLLSHVHSDHLVGLETCRSHFIYCSPATREILLRLEKYPHRMNFAKGILEARRQTYRHLKTLLKPIPLETPTDIELTPGNKIRVTLFDANHCVGAVMFLIEGHGNAIIYTGDVRSEQWWVESITRQPLLLPYICAYNSAPMKRLDHLYLDTTFASKSDPYRTFQSKAEGMAELLEKVSQHPPDTEFYIHSWTYGYEDVWQALSASLNSQIHVDAYRYGVYYALRSGGDPKAVEAARLVGFRCGNHEQSGCLTDQYRRLHSCENGTGCRVWENKDLVHIVPIVSRHNGLEMLEAGAGGGLGDLNQQHEIDLSDSQAFGDLMKLCVQALQDRPHLLSDLVQLLTAAKTSERMGVSLELADITEEPMSESQDDTTLIDFDQLPIERVVPLLVKRLTKNKQKATSRAPTTAQCTNGLPKEIRFPYSRHSSYSELCMLVDKFKPREITPCTVSKRDWKPTATMSYLFGHLYNETCAFSHDQMMLRNYNAARNVNGSQTSQNDASQGQVETQMSEELEQMTEKCQENRSRDGRDHSQCSRETRKRQASAERPRSQPSESASQPDVANQGDLWEHSTTSSLRPSSQQRINLSLDGEQAPKRPRKESSVQAVSKSLTPRKRSSSNEAGDYAMLVGDELKEALQREAYDAVLADGQGWSLVSVEGHCQIKEEEL